jgi:hypothetical protein
MKTCPHCAEQIQDAAIVCNYCGRDVLPNQPIQTPTNPVLPDENNSSPDSLELLPNPPKALPSQQQKNDNLLVIILIIIMGLCILFCRYGYGINKIW